MIIQMYIFVCNLSEYWVRTILNILKWKVMQQFKKNKMKNRKKFIAQFIKIDQGMCKICRIRYGKRCYRSIIINVIAHCFPDKAAYDIDRAEFSCEFPRLCSLVESLYNYV